MDDSGEIKPFRVVRADELGIRGTIIETIIRENRCILCGDFADREVWSYANSDPEKSNRIERKNYACSEECACMVAFRS